MGDSVREFLRSNPVEPEERPARPSRQARADMSRGAMTAWICGTLALIGLGGLYFATRMDPMERNAECQTTFGMDEDCILKNAHERLRGTYRNPNF